MNQNPSAAPVPLYELELPWPPSANAYWRIHNNRILVSRDARLYKTQIGILCLSQGVKPHCGELSAELIFTPPDRRRRDVHNLVKVLFDALEGYAYLNDSQLIDVHMKMLPEPVTNGACCLKLEPLT